MQSKPNWLPQSEARHVAGLMRANHSGEVCAQALYHGQALTAKLPNVRREMEFAAIEEQASTLAWCEDRLKELDSHTSLLNPVWYGLSFGMGALAGIAGDKYSLGFVVETERQVSLHLQHHISQSAQDERSRKILVQMNEDELHHRDTALTAGGVELPIPVKITMTAISKTDDQDSVILSNSMI